MGKRTGIVTVAFVALLLSLAQIACQRDQKSPAKPRPDGQGDSLPRHAIVRLGTTRFRCPGGVKAMAFSPDSKTIYAHCGTAHPYHNNNVIRGFAVDSGEQTVGITPQPAPGFTMNEEARQANLEQFYPTGECACLAADGTRVAFVTRGGRIRIVDLPSGKESGNLQVDPVVNQSPPVTILPSGKTLAVSHLMLGWSGGSGGRSFYDIATAKEIAKIGSTSVKGEGTAVEIVAVSPDETLAASTVRDERGIYFWDVRLGKQTKQIDVKNGIASLTFSPDGALLAYTEWPGAEVVLYDPAANKVVGRLRQDGQKATTIRNVSFASKGGRLATMDERGKVVVWDVANQKLLLSLATPAPRLHEHHAGPVLSPDGKLLAFQEDYTLVVVDVASGARLGNTGAAHRNGVLGVAIAPDAKTFYTRDRETIRMWDAAGRQARVLDEPAMSMALAADGKRLATMGSKSYYMRINGVDGFYVRDYIQEGPLKIWDLQGKGPPRQLDIGRTCRQVAFAPDLSTIAVADWFNKVVLFDGVKGEKIHEWKEDTRGELVYSADGKLIADNRIYSKMALLKRDSDRTEAIGGKPWAPAAAFTPDGKYLGMWESASGFRLYDVATRRLHEEFATGAIAADVAFTPDGKTVVFYGANETFVWDVAPPKKRLRLKAFPGPRALLPAFNAVAVLSKDQKTVLMVHNATGKVMGQLSGHRGTIRAFAVGLDGRILVTGSDDATALVWDVAAALRE